jgi:hypothetical protein
MSVFILFSQKYVYISAGSFGFCSYPAFAAESRLQIGNELLKYQVCCLDYLKVL